MYLHYAQLSSVLVEDYRLKTVDFEIAAAKARRQRDSLEDSLHALQQHVQLTLLDADVMDVFPDTNAGRFKLHLRYDWAF